MINVLLFKESVSTVEIESSKVFNKASDPHQLTRLKLRLSLRFISDINKLRTTVIWDVMIWVLNKNMKTLFISDYVINHSLYRFALWMVVAVTSFQSIDG